MTEERLKAHLNVVGNESVAVRIGLEEHIAELMDQKLSNEQLLAEKTVLRKALAVLAGRICGSDCAERYPEMEKRCAKCIAADALARTPEAKPPQ